MDRLNDLPNLTTSEKHAVKRLILMGKISVASFKDFNDDCELEDILKTFISTEGIYCIDG